MWRNKQLAEDEDALQRAVNALTEEEGAVGGVGVTPEPEGAVGDATEESTSEFESELSGDEDQSIIYKSLSDLEADYVGNE